MNAKYRELSAQLERERAWPPPYHVELTPEEVRAAKLPPGRYCQVAIIPIECDVCHYQYRIAAISTCSPACPRCHSMPHFPQRALDLQQPKPPTFEELGWPR